VVIYFVPLWCRFPTLNTINGNHAKAAAQSFNCDVYTFGDFQRFNPHLHVIATDGCFSDIGTFGVAPTANTADVQELFRHEVFKR